jgi:hypothetical protein
MARVAGQRIVTVTEPLRLETRSTSLFPPPQPMRRAGSRMTNVALSIGRYADLMVNTPLD